MTENKTCFELKERYHEALLNDNVVLANTLRKKIQETQKRSPENPKIAENKENGNT